MAWEPDYITLEQLRDFLEVPDDDTSDDALLAVDITAASRSIDTECNRQFGVTAAEARTYRAEWRTDKGRWVVVTDDFMAAPTAITADGSTVTGHRYGPLNAVSKGRPYERLELATDAAVVPVYPDYEVVVTAAWGWTAVPAAITLATRLQASRFAARRGSPYGVAGSPDLGNELRLLAKLDADVAVMVAGYVRTRRPV